MFQMGSSGAVLTQGRRLCRQALDLRVKEPADAWASLASAMTTTGEQKRRC